MFDLDGKSALITGASGAIGAAIARTLHEAGAAVALSGTREDALDALAETLGKRAYAVACDLGDRAAVAALPGRTEAAMGQIDILVNNAGLTHDRLALRMKLEDWDRVLEVNLTAAFRLAQLVLRGMMSRRWGRIIGISSIIGVTGNAGQANYAASKAGMIGMSKALALEVATRGITVNCIAPGFIATAMTEALPDKLRDATRMKIPAGGFGTPDDIAAAALYLASDEAGYMTGQTLHVNGGMAMI